MPIKIAIDLACGALNALGGWHILWMRRYMMPILMGASISFTTHIWWIGFTCLPAIGTLSLGYSKDGNAGRGLWLFIQAVSLSLGCLLLGHFYWFLFVPYIVGAGILGGIYKNWPQIVGDAITGTYLGAFIFFVR